MDIQITSVDNNFRIANMEDRKPKGFLTSPYPFLSLIRCLINYLLNGWWSYINPDRNKMKLLAAEGRIHVGGIKKAAVSSVKIAFLGDIMVSRSGKPPSLDEKAKKVLASADIIIANVEAPVVDSKQSFKRGHSLSFKMSSEYLAGISACNEKAQWVFSMANNHACDNSNKDETDVRGLRETARAITNRIPNAHVIGADIESARSVLSLQVKNGPKIGIVEWTELMNHDSKHFKKPIIRDTDITEENITKIKREHSALIGFAHGNEEQSYYPLKDLRDRWSKLMGPTKFDIIVGHGPHVLHPAESIRNQGLLFHSIGNFCSPKGRSQTKVGCIPEINLEYNGSEVLSMHYKVHLLQQHNEQISLLEDIDKAVYPDIIRRLKRIWADLFK